jgi:hypothetical protein
MIKFIININKFYKGLKQNKRIKKTKTKKWNIYNDKKNDIFVGLK